MVSSLTKLFPSRSNCFDVRPTRRPIKRNLTGSSSCGPSAVLCGKQHSNYIDFALSGQAKLLEKPLFISFLGLLDIDFKNFF
jgi:hypothetical protein